MQVYDYCEGRDAYDNCHRCRICDRPVGTMGIGQSRSSTFMMNIVLVFLLPFDLFE